MLKIYGVPISVHTRKVIVAALAKSLPYELVPVVPVVPGSPPANWREISPTGQIPAITDGDFTLADSGAICAYLERLHPGTPLYPGAVREHARVLSLEQYAGKLFRDVVHPLFNEVFVQPRIHQQATNPARVDAVLTQVLPELFTYLDGAAAGGDYLVGKDLSMADVAVVSNLVTYQYIGFDLYRERFAHLAALFDRVVRHPAMREALKREQAVVESMGLRGDAVAAALA